jgi:hypothetical protein
LYMRLSGRHNVQVLGSYRKWIQKRLEVEAMRAMQAKGSGSQAGIVKVAGRAVVRHCRAVARTGDAHLLRYTVLAVVRMLRTGVVGAKRCGGDNYGRGCDCKLCGDT